MLLPGGVWYNPGSKCSGVSRRLTQLSSFTIDWVDFNFRIQTVPMEPDYLASKPYFTTFSFYDLGEFTLVFIYKKEIIIVSG